MTESELTVKIADGEYWFSGIIDETTSMPYTKNTAFSFDAVKNFSYNQVSPMLISSSGRYVYAPASFRIDVADGEIRLKSPAPIDSGKEKDFKSAYLKLKDRYYRFDGRYPDENMFLYPQYCTWMALGNNHTEEGVLEYARGILKAGLPAGIIIIDDGWSDYYGQLEFAPSRFPHPAKMLNELREMGFSVMLWISPYVTADTDLCRQLGDKGYLLREKNGDLFICHWWQGYSACFDFSNPEAAAWFKNRIDGLIRKYGIKGIKADGSDAHFYRGNPVSSGNLTGNQLSESYGRFISQYPYNEIRATYRCEGLPVMERVADRCHCWDEEKGFKGIVKKIIVMGLSGYPFSCPDMVGGGHIDDVVKHTAEDDELNIRYLQASVFMPAIQFSKQLWKYPKVCGKIRKFMDLRQKYSPLIVKTAKASAKTGEPLIRSVLYEYGVHPEITDEFLIGRNFLVAPVTEKGAVRRTLYLPEGQWTYVPEDKIFEGDRFVTVSAPVDVLPYFTRRMK